MKRLLLPVLLALGTLSAWTAPLFCTTMQPDQRYACYLIGAILYLQLLNLVLPRKNHDL
jgi:hypothetical protein